MTEQLGGAAIWLKREDLLHTGAHKINNCLGQALLARRMGKKRIIAETGAGQHGVATATVCALFGFDCVVYMGEEDMRRQRLNVFRMRMLGAKVVGVTNGSRTLKDAISEAMRDWVTNVGDTYYLLGSALGRASVPDDGARLPQVIGEEARAADSGSRRPPARYRHSPASAAAATPSACSIAFLDDPAVELIGVEAGGRGDRSANMRRAIAAALPGVLQGAYSYRAAGRRRQIALTHSVSAGLDYAHDRPRARLAARSAARGIRRGQRCAKRWMRRGRWRARKALFRRSNPRTRSPKPSGARPPRKGKIFIVNVSGRGDKDIDIYRENLPGTDDATAIAQRESAAFSNGLKREKPQGPDRLPHRRAILARAHARAGGGAGARRRRPDRTRRAVLRSRSPTAR